MNSLKQRMRIRKNEKKKYILMHLAVKIMILLGRKALG